MRVRGEYDYMALWPIAIGCSRAGVRMDTPVPRTRQLAFRKLAAAVAVRGASSVGHSMSARGQTAAAARAAAACTGGGRSHIKVD